MPKLYKVPLSLQGQPEGGHIVTSPALAELLTEGDDLEQALENVRDALAAALEIYEDLGQPLPGSLQQDPQAAAIRFERLIVHY